MEHFLNLCIKYEEIFLPKISYIMAYYSKRHNKVAKLNNKLKNPILAPSGIFPNSKFTQPFFQIGISGLCTTHVGNPSLLTHH